MDLLLDHLDVWDVPLVHLQVHIVVVEVQLRRASYEVLVEESNLCADEIRALSQVLLILRLQLVVRDRRLGLLEIKLMPSQLGHLRSMDFLREYLEIDFRLQGHVQAGLRRFLHYSPVRSGITIALEPGAGHVLGLLGPRLPDRERAPWLVEALVYACLCNLTTDIPIAAGSERSDSAGRSLQPPLVMARGVRRSRMKLTASRFALAERSIQASNGL